MIKINTEKLPKLIINDLSYLIYYSIYGFIISFLFIVPILSKFIKTSFIINDYTLFIQSLLLGVFIGLISKKIITPIERKIIKRNIFIAWLVTVLKKHKSIIFGDIIKDYSYFVFQNRKVTSRYKDWASYIEVLISLWIIDLKNHKLLKDKYKDFDYKYFNKKLFEAELVLKDRKVNIDELIKRLDNYVL